MTGKKKRATKKARGKIKLSLASKLVQKNDKTRVKRKANNTRKSNGTNIIPQAPVKMYRDNGANFIIKIRKK